MFLDTSGLFAYLSETEAKHSRARSLLETYEPSFTHSLVLVEFIALANARNFSRAKALEFVSEIMHHPIVDVVWVDRPRILHALSFLGMRLDKTYSLCDAVSFQLMSERRIEKALTTDHHFEQEGFSALLR